ncbi:50S ribosomal protein L29 [Leptolyngbya sp. 15MV]|nr:50S ribosomal protein L29 [Leptolyngbya sp. 15MV]
MTPTEVRQLTDDQLKAEVASTRNRLFKLRSQAVTEKVENTGQFRELRRDLARLLTERTSRRSRVGGSGR